MKNALIAALLLAGMIGYSQKSPEPGRQREKVEMSAEQRNDLRLKRMTLKLDLDNSQQKEMAKIISGQEKNRSEARAKMKERRETKVKPTADELYAMQSKKLDREIEMRSKMKKLLNEKQFEKWESMKHDRNDRRHKGFRGHENKSRRSHGQNRK